MTARDLGGRRRLDGPSTPRGVFFRSDNVDWLSPDAWDELHAAGVRTIVDLRQQWERSRDVSTRPDWVTTVAVDLDGLDNQEFWKDYWDTGLAGTPAYYLPHLEAMPERAVRALSAIVSARPGAVLFHCMSGRDRTGLVAMLLLAAIEVEPDEIVDDYLETAGRNDPSIEAAFRAALESLDLSRVLAGR
jgi:protein tyrosine/serine phosphatase